MKSQYNPLEPVAKARVATAMAASLSFCSERKYLEGITKEDAPFILRATSRTSQLDVKWIAVTQVGKPLEKSAENCFIAIQKILYSCFLPKEVQLLFLIIGDGYENSMYIGLRGQGQMKRRIKHLNEFIKGVWPGLQTDILKGDEPTIQQFKANIKSEKLDNVYAITGIPSMETLYKTVYPATIDTLMAGMNKSKNYAYLVVANPIETNDVETMLYECREMDSQAESLKSMNVTDSLSHGTNSSYSHTSGVSHTDSLSESISKKDFSALGKVALSATGLGMAASIFPAAASVMEGFSNAAGTVTSAATSLIAGSMVGNFITNLMPTKQTTHGTSDTTSSSDTISHGESETQSQSISRNIVNKHIEAMAEHLYHHSKRFETGKAIGLWEVGAYILAENEGDAEGGAMQLRSIMSGQESIFEPIRIHRLTDIMEQQINGGRLIENTFGQLAEPKLQICGVNGLPFHHPFGTHFQELKSVLTTKELSYLINFPLRSVPGISVVDSSPEFSLNRPQNILETDAINFGKLLYGGSETGMEYPISIRSLSRHALLSGINGSGKTNTVQAILNNLSGRIPFLVIEPAKTEYVDWAIEYNKKHPDNPINIFIPGCKSYKDKKNNETITNLKQLKLNPFELVWLQKDQTPNVLSHIDRLKSTFAAAFPMYDILPVLMEDLLYTLYQNKSTDWLTTEPEYGKTMYPTLNSMSITVDKVIQNRGYEERVERNMKACFNTRIDSLKRGWKGEMLNTTHSTPWEELFEKPCVINLSYVGDDVDKGFFMSVILQFLYEYRIAQAETREIDLNDNGCRHLTIIEEAHRVMMKCEQPDMPQYKTAMMFSNMLSEIRAYGEGMLLVDQVPTRLISDAIKNTNLKITHRLVAEDDCKAISESMGLNDEQRKVIQKLLTGQCIVSNSLSTDTYWLKANKAK